MHEEIVRILSVVPRAGMNGLVRKNCIPSFVLATRLVWLRHRCCKSGDYTQAEGLRPGSSATARRLEDAASGDLGALLLRRHVREIWLLTL